MKKGREKKKRKGEERVADHSISEVVGKAERKTNLLKHKRKHITAVAGTPTK